MGKIKSEHTEWTDTYLLVARKPTGKTTGRLCRGKSSFISVGKVITFREFGTLVVIEWKVIFVRFDIFSSHSPKILNSKFSQKLFRKLGFIVNENLGKRCQKRFRGTFI